MAAYNTLYNSVIHRYVPEGGLPAEGAAGAVFRNFSRACTRGGSFQNWGCIRHIRHTPPGQMRHSAAASTSEETPWGCVLSAADTGLIGRALNGPGGLPTGPYDRNAARILAGRITAGVTPVTPLRGDRV